MTTCDVLILGAGSVGLPMSHALACKGLSVVVLEQHPSFGRGQNRAAIGGIRATHSDPAKIRLCQRSIAIMSTFEQRHGMDVDWEQGGYLYPVYDEARENTLKTLLVTQKSHHLNIDWITPAEVEALVPGISTQGLRGGTFSPEDGYASPLKTADAYHTLARREGVVFRFNETVTGMVTEGGRIVRVDTTVEQYSASVVINAAGVGAGSLAAMVGTTIPVYSDCHEGGVTEPVQRFFQPMVVDIRPNETSLNYYFYQNKEGQVVFCITPLPPIIGEDIDNTSDFLPQVVERMTALYPRLRHLRVRRTWRGLYPQTPDGFPILGWSREAENFFLACGMCGQGYMIGPGLGEIVAELLADRSPAHDDILEQLSPYRSFSREEVLK